MMTFTSGSSSAEEKRERLVTMEQPRSVRVKMKYLDKVKVTTLASKQDPRLSSVENLKRLVYAIFPELETQSENSCAWRSFKLDVQCEDGDGDLVTIENDEDLKSVVEWQKSNNFLFVLKAKKREPEAGSTRHDWSAKASSSSATKETRGKKLACRSYNFGKGQCRFGANCHFAHDQDGNGRSAELERPSPGVLNSRVTPRPPREITNYGFWLREQFERDPSDNITFFSRDKGLDVLTKIVDKKNLPTEWIDLLVKLLTREEFRLSLMREHTNRVYGLLIGSTFLLQLHGHITSQLGIAKPQDVTPYLLLIEELQYRTSDGWKEVPLDAVNNVIQQLEEGAAKQELVMLVNRLIDHRNKLHRQCALSPADDENRFLGAEFRNMSIVPDKSELLQPHLTSDLPVNLVGKKYTSVLKYLETHFRLLREDCIDPLRQGISAYRNKQHSRELRIYQEVKLAGYRCGEEDVEYSVCFQDNRGNWEGSKRLLYGALVCLSYDGFQDSFLFGVVTQRNFQGSGATKFSVCIRMMGSSAARGEEHVAYDRIYVMVESTTAYFESYYHVLKSLQREEMENIPLTKYLLHLEQQVDPPFYLLRREERDEFDFEAAFLNMKADLGRSRIHVLQEWPEWPSSLDPAQLQALKHGLTKELSIIQGPPGTGKTFLGLLLVKLLLANFKPAEKKADDEMERGRGRGRMTTPVRASNDEERFGRKGPILVICMTNHALDQFLEGIYKFERNLIRIGGRSKSTVLQERTLKKLLDAEKLKSKDPNSWSSGHRIAKGRAWSDKASLEEKILKCIEDSNAKILRKDELIDIATEQQIRTLFSVGLKWKETVERWLEGDVFPLQGNPFQDSSLGYDDGMFEEPRKSAGKTRRGQVIMLTRPEEERNENGWQVQGRRRGRHNRGRRQPPMYNMNVAVGGEEAEVLHQLDGMQRGDVLQDDLPDGREEMDEVDPDQPDLEQVDQNEEMQIQYFVDFPDVWRLNAQQRRILYDYWREEVGMKCRRQLQELTREYERACGLVTEVDDEIKLSLLRRANVVGITTTTAARHHKILQALNSEILIVEEAAEVLEGHVLAGLSSCVKHLVLIGDHLQLRPSTAVHQLGTKHKLDVSMFERLLEGGVEHVALQEQRRMRPSFSKLVRSLYPQLKDHESVTKYENVRGVNSNLLFFDHTAEENSTAVDTSKVNTVEAKLVVELALYLLKQDYYSTRDITILSMYTGQIMEIRRIMRERASISLSAKYLERMRKMHERLLPEEEEEDDDSECNEVKEEESDIAKLLPRVSSVDDFQGEEADIIILSLVRSNDIQTNSGEGAIGFVKTSNRICVALTRAKKGMYIFGNATLLAKRSPLWNKVIGTLRKDEALSTKLELVCQNHPETITAVRKEEDFRQVADGGCSKPCEVQLECGHVCPRRCHRGSHDDVVCPKPCRRRYSDCHHECREVCHGNNTCPPCQTKVIKTFLDCGHSQHMKCFKDPAEETCRAPCVKFLICGHMCERDCGVPCTDKCMRKVWRNLPCGHRKELPCHEDPLSYPCKELCKGILPGCEHQCQGNCGLCLNGAEHIPCLQKCGRILPCGHACEAGCSAPCPPCKKKCQKRCVHSRCQFLCGEMCVPCREPCAWRCEHNKCELLCHEICIRPRCDVPCKKVLRCGHPCIGLCGEPCPSKCRTCDADTSEIITQMTLGDFEDNDRFHQLQDCKHLFEVSGLDTWMDSDDMQEENGRRSAAVKLKECPQCKAPVWRSARYANVVKTKLAKLEEVKKRIYGHQKIKQAQQKLEQGDPATSFLLFIEALGQNPTLMEAHFGAGRALCESKQFAHAAVFLSFVVEKSSYATEVGSLLKSTSDLDKTLGTSRADCPPTKDELAVKAMLQLASTFTALGEFSSAEKFCEVVISSQPENEDARTIRRKAKKGLIAEVVQAMSSEMGPGHWFQCPNGHYYTIGECGGAMQLSKCPDCNELVGGGQHRLTTGNRHANIDGSSRPAWPGGN